MPYSERSKKEYKVQIGEVVGAHGIQGEVRVALHTDFPERFEQLDSIYVRPRGRQGRLMAISSQRIRPDKGQVLLRLEGIQDRDSAEALRGAGLWISEDQLVPLDDGSYYEFQIIGLMAKTTDGQVLGEVSEIIHTGANDVYVTACCLIPAIAEVVKEIDIERGELLVEPVAGLLD